MLSFLSLRAGSVSDRGGRNKTLKGIVRPKLKLHPHFLLSTLTVEALVTHFHDTILEMLVSRFIYTPQELAILSRSNMNAAPPYEATMDIRDKNMV